MIKPDFYKRPPTAYTNLERLASTFGVVAICSILYFALDLTKFYEVFFDKWLPSDIPEDSMSFFLGVMMTFLMIIGAICLWGDFTRSLENRRKQEYDNEVADDRLSEFDLTMDEVREEIRKDIERNGHFSATGYWAGRDIQLAVLEERKQAAKKKNEDMIREDKLSYLTDKYSNVFIDAKSDK